MSVDTRPLNEIEADRKIQQLENEVSKLWRRLETLEMSVRTGNEPLCYAPISGEKPNEGERL